MKIVTALLIAALLVLPGAAVANDGKDELIAAQENLLDAYRCLISIDLELVEQGCPGKFQPPIFLPTAWTFYGLDDIRQSNFGLANHGGYIPAIRNGSSLSLDCQQGVIVPRIRFSGQKLTTRKIQFEEQGLTIERSVIHISYTAGNITTSDLWFADDNGSTVTAVHPDPHRGEFLDHLIAADGGNLRVIATDADGKSVTTQFSLIWTTWAVGWVRHHCDTEFLNSE